MRQILITIGREFGSGGHAIADNLGKLLNLTVYDKNILDEMVERFGYDREALTEHEESPVSVIFSKKVRGFSSSVKEVVAQRQFELIKEKADSGESFIVVGRCAVQVLAEYEGRTSFFIIGDEQAKIRRIMKEYKLDENAARELMIDTDRKRKAYHNYHCDMKWGDCTNYDMCVNSSKLGIEGTTELLYKFIVMKEDLHI